jgi:hypothetical protein
MHVPVFRAFPGKPQFSLSLPLLLRSALSTSPVSLQGIPTNRAHFEPKRRIRKPAESHGLGQGIISSLVGATSRSRTLHREVRGQGQRCEILRQSLTEPLVSLTLERAPRGKLAATQRRLLVDGLRDENGLRVGLFPLAYLGIAHRFPLKRSRAGMPWCLQIIRRTGGLAVTPHSTADSQLNPVIDYTRKRPESQRENPQWWRPHFGGNRRRQWVRREPHPPLRGHPNAKGMAKPSS